MRSKVLCRGCVSFNKMQQFIQRAQSIENTPSDQSSECAVQLSPSSLQPSTHLSSNMSSESSVHVEEPSKPITPTRKQLLKLWRFQCLHQQKTTAQPLLRISRSEILRGLHYIRLSRHRKMLPA